MIMENTMWFYRLLDEQVGPVSLSTLQELIREEHLGTHDLVRNAGGGTWRPVSEVLSQLGMPDEATSDDLDLMLATDVPSSHDLDMMLTAEPAQPQQHVARWFCRLFNQELGPFSYDELRLMAESGELGPADPLRGEHTDTWEPALSIEHLFTGIQPSSSTSAAQNYLAPQRTASAASRWFCRILNQELGPFDRAALRTMAENGELSQSDPIRCELSQTWVAAESISGLFAGIALSIPSTDGVTNTLSPQRMAIAKPQPAQPATRLAAGSPETRTTHAEQPIPPTIVSPAVVSSAIVPPRPSPPPVTLSRPSAPPMAATRTSAAARGGSGNRGSEFKIDRRIAGVVAALVVLPLIYFFAPLPAFGSNRSDYDQLSGIWIQIVNMHNENVPEEEWKKFSALAKEKIALHKQSLKGQSQTELVKLLLEVHDECLPVILSGSPAERTAAIDEMRLQMMRGTKILDGR